jgi:hypothetical protein
VGDDGQGVEWERPQVVDAAADALAIAAAIIPFPAVGLVVGDRAARDADARGAGDVDGAAEADAAVLAVAADRLVVVNGAVTDRGGRLPTPCMLISATVP